MGELGNQPPNGATLVETPKVTGGGAVRPRTQEKPGTGTPDAKPEKVAGGAGRPTGEIDYPDGYTMGRDETGSWYLKDGSGERGQWSDMAQDWVDPETGARKPSSWGKQYWPGGTGEAG